MTASTSCQKSRSQDLEYSILKKKSYASLNPEAQSFFSDELTAQLKKDADFQLYQKSLKGIMISLSGRDRSMGKMSGTPPKGLEARLAFYKEAGVKNPQELVMHQLNMINSMAKVMKKYPELTKLDKQTRTRVIKDAAGKLDRETKDKIKTAVVESKKSK